MSLSASATFEPHMLLLRYVDVVLIVMVAPLALLMGAPALGVGVGAGAWVLQRAGGAALDRRALAMADKRRALTLKVAWSLVSVWLLAIAILAVGLTAHRRDGLAAALLILGAFSVYFAMSLVTRGGARR